MPASDLESQSEMKRLAAQARCGLQLKFPAERKQNSMNAKQNQDIVQSWHAKARAYESLIRRWPIFRRMANRLIDSIPAQPDFNGHILDIGGGSGLVAQQILQRYPKAQITLVDPAEEMCKLAQSRFGNRIKVKKMAGDQIHHLDVSADGALCSAAFHLMDEQTTFPAIGAILKPGSVFALNLWGHSFDETAQLDQRINWSIFVSQALIEQQESPLPNVKKAERRPRNLETLIKIGKSCGLQFQKKAIIEEKINAKFHIEFAAMDSAWLGHLKPERREQIIGRALDLAKGESTIFCVDFSFVKRD